MRNRCAVLAAALLLSQHGLAAEPQGAQQERAAIRQPGDLRATDLSNVAEPRRPPIDGCPKTTYQYTPSPLDDLNMDVLSQADETLVVALDLLGVHVDAGERTVDMELLHKSQILARYLVAICRSGGCPRRPDND